MSAEISRRRVVQGIAWAAPAIVIASAVPAAAASVAGGVTTSAQVIGVWAEGSVANALHLGAHAQDQGGLGTAAFYQMDLLVPAALVKTPYVTGQSSGSAWTLVSGYPQAATLSGQPYVKYRFTAVGSGRWSDRYLQFWFDYVRGTSGNVVINVVATGGGNSATASTTVAVSAL